VALVIIIANTPIYVIIAGATSLYLRGPAIGGDPLLGIFNTTRNLLSKGSPQIAATIYEDPTESLAIADEAI
jgi:hypothetical protein